MNIEEQKERQDFFDYISKYQYFRNDGRLLLEPFGVHLSHCFGFDGILEKSPQPTDVYLLLLKIIQDSLGEEDTRRYVQFQRIADWTPEMEFIYPDKTMTCIHVSALSQVSHDWIYAIGHDLMGIPDPEPSKYFDWAREEWVAVYAFINGYHNALNLLQKKIDRDSINNNGYSSFEALHLCVKEDISFDEAVDLLRTRHESYQTALERIEKALNDGYFLEAITLEECLISNCLFNFLSNTGAKLTNPSFHLLLKEIIKSDAEFQERPTQLFEAIDKWRKARNTAIHGFITTRSDGLSQSKKEFQNLSETTSKEGESFCKLVVDWYELECVNFIKHEFPSKHSIITH